MAAKSFNGVMGTLAVIVVVALATAPAAPAQELEWAVRAGDLGPDEGRGIAVDSAGNTYVTGFFHGTATFVSADGSEIALTSTGFADVFVAKYDPDGNLLWVRRAGGTSEDRGLGIAVDGDGNSYVTGFFTISATFGPGELNEETLVGPSREIFIAKYDPDGNLLWAKRAGGIGTHGGRGIAVDGDGNSYVTGFYSFDATFGPGELNETTLTTPSILDMDIFIAKYDRHGNLVWARHAGGTNIDEGRAIAVDGHGNTFVTGIFGDTATFGPGEGTETILSAPGFSHIFVAKYNPNGNLVWAKRAGGMFSDSGNGACPAFS